LQFDAAGTRDNSIISSLVSPAVLPAKEVVLPVADPRLAGHARCGWIEVVGAEAVGIAAMAAWCRQLVQPLLPYRPRPV
jgi:hypothetical protein